MDEFLKILVVFGWSAFKYMIGISSALLFDLHFILSIIVTVCGGMLGVIAYLYCWDLLLTLKEKIFPRRKKKVKVTKFRRWLVHFMNNYGLFGIAFLTPVLLSVPVGTLLAASMEPDKWKIKRFMLLSFINWSLLFFGFFQLMDIDAKDIITRLLK